MNKDEHRTYIRSSLMNLFKETIYTLNHLGKGMEFFAVSNQLLNTLFLQMTGAQEQKMKCICWELATDDLDYRYKRYYEKWDLNQCSTLKDKGCVYEDLMSAIKKKEEGYKLFVDKAAKETFRDDLYNQFVNVMNSTNIICLYKDEYEKFKAVFQNIDVNSILPSDKQIFKKGDGNAPVEKATSETELFAIYHLLYRHRNRCAHNTLSYQLNLPHLNMLRNEKFQKYNNIFLFLATLLMIDEIFRKLFEKYESLDSF